MHEVIIIGAGITGSYLAKRLHEKYDVLVIEKNESSGGVWFSTNWSWLTSDTSAVFYSPKDAAFIGKYMFGGVPKNEILKETQLQLHNVKNILFSHTVEKIVYNDILNYWSVHVRNIKDDNIKILHSIYVINACGLYTDPFIPETIHHFLLKSNVHFKHSSQITDVDLQHRKKVAIIGARESAMQIMRNLSSNNVQIDWYARSFNNWYLNTSDEAVKSQLWFLGILYHIPLIGVFLFNIVRHFVHNHFHNFLIDTLRGIMNNQKPKLNQAFYKTHKELIYDYKQPIRPVFTRPFDMSNIRKFSIEDLLTNTDMNKYDIVIPCTGYIYDQPFQIIYNNSNVEVDLFNLIDYTIPTNIPQYFSAVPIAVSTYLQIETMIDSIDKKISEHYIQPNEHEIVTFFNNRQRLLQTNDLSKEKLQYHCRHKPMLYTNRI
jgi:hypothetical protein